VIDFRYHLVSLISVFLALAVGIVLGAGPLKESIGDTLTGEVDALRERAADLRSELDDRSRQLAESEAAFESVADDLVAGTLTDRRVAVVTFGDGDQGATAAVIGWLEQAGATVTTTVRLSDDWVDTTRATFRRTLAGTLVEYLDPAPAAEAGPTTELAEALVQALSTAVPEDPDALGENARVVLQLLVESGLIEVGGEVTLPADAVVVVAGGFDEDLAPADPEDADEDELAALADLVDRWVGVARELAYAAQARTEGGVVAAHAPVDGGILAQLRGAEQTSSRISTVAEVDRLVGQVGVPLALAERIAGTVGHYGTGPGTTAPVPPRVVLDPIERIPELPLTPEGEDAAGEGAGAEGAEGGAGTDGTDANG
jgi:hypothetical protein